MSGVQVTYYARHTHKRTGSIGRRNWAAFTRLQMMNQHELVDCSLGWALIKAQIGHGTTPPTTRMLLHDTNTANNNTTDNNSTTTRRKRATKSELAECECRMGSLMRQL